MELVGLMWIKNAFGNQGKSCFASEGKKKLNRNCQKHQINFFFRESEILIWHQCCKTQVLEVMLFPPSTWCKSFHQFNQRPNGRREIVKKKAWKPTFPQSEVISVLSFIPCSPSSMVRSLTTDDVCFKIYSCPEIHESTIFIEQLSWHCTLWIRSLAHFNICRRHTGARTAWRFGATGLWWNPPLRRVSNPPLNGRLSVVSPPRSHVDKIDGGVVHARLEKIYYIISVGDSKLICFHGQAIVLSKELSI